MRIALSRCNCEVAVLWSRCHICWTCYPSDPSNHRVPPQLPPEHLLPAARLENCGGSCERLYGECTRRRIAETVKMISSTAKNTRLRHAQSPGKCGCLMQPQFFQQAREGPFPISWDGSAQFDLPP